MTYSDGSEFFRRAALFQAELEKNSYPNSTSLAELAGCSRNTAQRTVDKLKKQLQVPIAYDSGRKGYYLTEPTFRLPFVSPTRRELHAVLLLRRLVSDLGLDSVGNSIEVLWERYAAAAGGVADELDHLECCMTSCGTSPKQTAAVDVLEILECAASGAKVEVSYHDFWSNGTATAYTGQISRANVCNGEVLLCLDSQQQGSVRLKARCIEQISVIGQGYRQSASCELTQSCVYHDDEMQTVEVKIRQPAAAYFAKERWCEDQLDEWENTVLVRTFRGKPGPELELRLLGVGKFLMDVKPLELKHAVLRQVNAMQTKLKK